MNMKRLTGGTITLSTLALAAGLTLFFLSLMPVLALGLMVAAAGLFAALALFVAVKAIIDYRNRPILAKGIAAGIVDSKGIPIVTVQEETAVIFTPAHQVVLEAILSWNITPVAQRVNAIVEAAKKISPCAILDNLAIAYPLGAANGVATRNLEETVADEAYNKKWGKSLGVNGYVCQVAKVWAMFSCVYNHIDDLRNSKDSYSPLIIISRMAMTIGYMEELEKELECEQELRPKISFEAWEALSVKATPPIIKRPKSAIEVKGSMLKKALQAEGIAEAVQLPAIKA